MKKKPQKLTKTEAQFAYSTHSPATIVKRELMVNGWITTQQRMSSFFNTLSLVSGRVTGMYAHLIIIIIIS